MKNWEAVHRVLNDRGVNDEGVMIDINPNRPQDALRAGDDVKTCKLPARTADPPA